MDIEKIEKGIKEAFDCYELFFLRERLKKFESRDKEVCGVEVKEEIGVSLRAIKDERMVFSYTYEEEDKAARSLIDNAIPLLPFLEEDRDRVFPEKFASYPRIDIYDREGLSVDDNLKISLLIDMERTILEYDKRIQTTKNCELHEEEIEVTLVNSLGLRAETRKSLFSIMGMCVAKDKDEASWFDWSWALSLQGLDFKGLGELIAGKAVSLLSSTQIATGTYDGILTPQASCDLLGILASSFLAENLYKKKTRLSGKTGAACFSPLLSITDSGLVGIECFPFDGEGVPSMENHVVREGRFETFLYDGYYGRKLGKPSTGNAVRGGIKETPTCGPRGLYIEKGTSNVDEGGFKGVIIAELMGTHTANPITGDFSLGATGYLQKQGSRTPFTGVILSGNVFDLLNSVKAVGTDLKFIGSYGSPSLLIEGLKISGT